MSEAITVPRLMMTSIVFKESLARDRQTHVYTHTDILKFGLVYLN